MKYTKNKRSIVNIGVLVAIFLIIGAIAFLFLSPTFERNAPKIKVDEQVYWNLQKPINVLVGDDYGIKSYEINFVDGDRRTKLETKVVNSQNGILDIEVTPPSLSEMTKVTNGILEIKVIDTSKWNFFNGNEAITTSKIIIDKRSPIANVLTNSYLLRQGGSGVIVAEINDDNLKDYYVSFNDQEFFALFPFHKPGYFISIITWPLDIKEFSRVNIVAIDKANNKTVTKVPFYIKPFKEKIDDIQITDSFVNTISKQVLQNSDMQVPDGIVDAFVKTNKELREKNVNTIKDVVRKNLQGSSEIPFDVKTFVRMTNAATFAQFGERRHYFYNNQQIDEAWHLGMDWASTKRADIVVTNPGKVIFKGYLGIYGDTMIIDHGLGLSTLYAHTSSQAVEVNDMVKTGQVIGNTGSTGAVFGDHLHFGVVVQGIEVNPNEWLDYNWIKLNLTNVMNDAIKMIDGIKK